MQALEKIQVLEKDEERGGRRITQQGQRDLDRECPSPETFVDVSDFQQGSPRPLLRLIRSPRLRRRSKLAILGGYPVTVPA